MNFIKVFAERWKFYLVSYILGYVISLFTTGIPSIFYLIPIKMTAIVIMIFIGNAFYHASRKMPVYLYPIKGMKYILIVLAVMVVFYSIKAMLLLLGIDVTPLLGIS